MFDFKTEFRWYDITFYLGFTEWKVSLIGTIFWQGKQAGLEYISQKLLQTAISSQVL